jgi:hypothetical protein
MRSEEATAVSDDGRFLIMNRPQLSGAPLSLALLEGLIAPLIILDRASFHAPCGSDYPTDKTMAMSPRLLSELPDVTLL